MCGIAGIIGPIPAERLEGSLRAMLSCQVHRGPDDGGVHLVETPRGIVGLGNRRLAVQDVSQLGHQPMPNPDTGDVLAYNGEIYNAPELRRTLEQAGYSFRGHSDTEVLLRAFEHWGTGCIDRLRGMFAFAIWDARRERLVIARDHIGMKPLYHAALPGGGLAFASELRSVLAGGLVPFELDPRAVAGYLAFGAVQEPLTSARGVSVVPAGTWMEVDASGRVTAEDRFWEIPAPDPARAHAPLASLVEEGRALLEHSVKRHLISDVPLGVFLSSGIDSTAVLGMAQKVAPGQARAFTVSFPDDPRVDEASVARATAARLGVEYHECGVDQTTALRWAQGFLDSADQPTMDGLNTYIVSRAVREQGIVVALSGQGGDEVFAGYPTFRQLPRLHRWMRSARFLPAGVRGGLAAGLAAAVAPARRGKARDLAAGGAGLASLYFRYRKLVGDRELASLGVDAGRLGLTESLHLPSWGGDRWVVPGDAVASVARLETMYYLGNVLLRDGDVYGMASSLEIRVPLLDRDLMDWAYRLPGSVLQRPGAPAKHLLREMCREYYTDEQAALPKRGFSPPYALWMVGPLRETVEECLAAVKQSGTVSPRGVDAIYARFRAQPHRGGWGMVWSLVTLGHWLKSNAGGARATSFADVRGPRHAAVRGVAAGGL